jgi:glycerol-3-phosphate acyltransferase PlsX
MSGDHGLRVSVPASLQVLQESSRIHLHLVGDEPAIQREINRHDGDPDTARLTIVHAAETLPMDAKPTRVLRGSQQSSMHVALSLLADARVEGVVSAGNTGALMALGRLLLEMLPGFQRPAFCSTIPVRQGATYMLDLGANVDCSARHLHEFALMGSALAFTLQGCERPRVALLSNGKEVNKGNSIIRTAADLLDGDSTLNYCGYIEGDEIHNGDVEVIVCDGLVGNIALKVAEGTAGLAADLIAEKFSHHWWHRLVGALSAPLLSGLSENLSAERHGGAFLLGLQGVVIKSHGGASETGFGAALKQAAECIDHEMVPRLVHHLNSQENE